MKHLLIPLLFIVASLSANAQISEDRKSMSLGVQNALVLEIPDADVRNIERFWREFIRPYGGKTKKDRRNDEWYTFGGNVTGIGNVDIYARSEAQGDDVEQVLWIDLGEENFLSSERDASAYEEAERLLIQFGLFVTREYIEIELSEEEKELNKLENNLKKLKRNNDNYNKIIEDAKAKIAQAEADIAQNEIDQETTAESIEAQKKIVEMVRKKLKDF